jgi:transcriptional regulator with XRE-family HTH domain
MTFAERLTALRKHHSLTHQALADRVGIHVTLLRRYEAGKTQPNLDTLRQIALALSIGADLLLFDEDERGPTDDPPAPIRSHPTPHRRRKDDRQTRPRRTPPRPRSQRWAA